jgi:hypothetical protein
MHNNRQRRDCLRRRSGQPIQPTTDIRQSEICDNSSLLKSSRRAVGGGSAAASAGGRPFVMGHPRSALR